MARFIGILSFGVFLIIVAVWLASWALGTIQTLDLIPLILSSSGVWTVIVAGIKVYRKDEESAFGTFGWGMFFIVLGSSLYMINVGIDPVYTIVFVLALVGALAIIAALKMSRK